MGCKNLFCFVLIFLVISWCVDSQICTERKRDYVSRTEMRNTTYYLTYIGLCYDNNHDYDDGGIVYECIKKRQTWSTKPVTVTEYDYKTVHKCCPGYIQDDTSDSESIKCKAVCKVHCENGFCDQPDVCSCREGYRKKKVWYGTVCEPVCESNCTNGKCVSPNTCECNHGYTSQNGTCEPVCSDPCINGDCTAPETCECLPGYRKSNSSVCEAYCSTGCEHGECVAPETCHCNPGWHKINNTLYVETCMPVCNEICNNETCVPPDSCVCKPGYVKTGVNQCSFKCSKCKYGKCVHIETCACFEPWTLNEDGTDCVFTELSSSGTDPTASEKTLTDVMTTDEEAMIDPNVIFTLDSTSDPTTYRPIKDIYWVDDYAESSNAEKETDQNLLYILLGIFLLLVVMTIIMLIVYKNKILRYFKGAEYIVEDCPKHDASETLVNVTYSSVRKESD